MATVLVTGSNKGIGLELCRQLSDRGHGVIATCRRTAPELEALGVRVVPGVDVANQESVEALAGALDGERIDTLINNAGILTVEALADLDLDQIRQQIEVNTLGPLRVTSALLPNLVQVPNLTTTAPSASWASFPAPKVISLSPIRPLTVVSATRSSIC